MVSDPEQGRVDAGVSRRRVQRLARQIGTWIAGARLDPGDPLPDATGLARRFGATRGTIRAALSLLEDQGILSREAGQFAVLHPDPVGQARATLALHFRLGGLTVGDIYEMRLLIEPEIAAQLAGRLSDETLDELAAALRSIATDPPQVIALGLHARLAREAGNPLLVFLMDFLAELLAEYPDRGGAVTTADEAFRHRSRVAHVRLLAALRDGHAAGARRAMLDHLESVQHYLEARDSGLLSRYVAE